ncbi:hypothetical protein SORBI_3001G540250 [Sorghum bicolor]|uniref:Uncharacterized protein n=1 Tax=Sorghum bicolor TaxID=4558 RepID=A0A1Z5SBY9_SORBI|nr:hypothetical protein SORBI_3001G540250 [Sorghum bicolor]
MGGAHGNAMHKQSAHYASSSLAFSPPPPHLQRKAGGRQTLLRPAGRCRSQPIGNCLPACLPIIIIIIILPLPHASLPVCLCPVVAVALALFTLRIGYLVPACPSTVSTYVSLTRCT